ncbi:MAG: hypothetical protein ACKOFZ_02785 [Ilumatobacteraceae bacterium]
MHPIEYLRYVARASGADPSMLVSETASALRAMRLDQPGFVLATRRIVDKHPTCAPLWWLCAGALSALDPASRLRELAEEFESDPTAWHLMEAEHDDALVVEALAMGHDAEVEVLVGAFDVEDLEWAHQTERTTILVARRGTRLPREMWREMKRRATAADNPWTTDVRVIGVADFDLVVDPQGVGAGDDYAFAPECAPCPELLVGGGL